MASHGVVSADEIRARLKKPMPEGATLENGGDRLMTPAEVAPLFKVDPKTISRWAQRGRIKAIKTVGGHRRFRESDVRAALKEMDEQ